MRLILPPQYFQSSNKSYFKPKYFKNNTIFKPLFQLSLNPILKDVIKRAI
jgi:hypothetical protein